MANKVQPGWEILAKRLDQTPDQLRGFADQNFPAGSDTVEGAMLDPVSMKMGPTKVGLQTTNPPGVDGKPAAPVTYPGSGPTMGLMGHPAAKLAMGNYSTLASMGGTAPAFPLQLSTDDDKRALQANMEQNALQQEMRSMFPSRDEMIRQAEFRLSPLSPMWGAVSQMNDQQRAGLLQGGLDNAERMTTASQSVLQQMLAGQQNMDLGMGRLGLDTMKAGQEDARSKSALDIERTKADTEAAKLNPMYLLKSGLAQGMAKRIEAGQAMTPAESKMQADSINILAGSLGAAPGQQGSIGVQGGPMQLGAQPQLPGQQPVGANDPEMALLELVGAETIGKLRGDGKTPVPVGQAWETIFDQLGTEGLQKNQQSVRKYLNAKFGKDAIQSYLDPGVVGRAFALPGDVANQVASAVAAPDRAAGKAAWDQSKKRYNIPVSERLGAALGTRDSERRQILRKMYNMPGAAY